LRRTLALVVPLLLLACDKQKRPKPSTEDTSSTHDTGPASDPDLDCDTGQLEDDGECVPAACGTGTWGDLEVDEGTIYVDMAAGEGGDGSEAAPFTYIQAGLDAAGDADGGMVAVAAGTYPETLELGRGHDGVHLAGRCKELVVIDASVGDKWTPGLKVDALSSEVEVSGVTVSGSHYSGVLVGSGTMTIRDSGIIGSEHSGVGSFQAGIQATVLTMESCEVKENNAYGVLAYDSGTSVSLRETSIEGTKPDGNGESGYGIEVYRGASLDAEGCEIGWNIGLGVFASGSGTSVTLRETNVQDTQLDGNGNFGYGIEVDDGASLDAEACEVRGNTTAGVIVDGSGSSVTLRETSIEDTKPDEDGELGTGIAVIRGANLDAEGCELRGNSGAGVAVADSGTSVSLRDISIEDTKPDENGIFGFGIEVLEGANLDAEGCELRGNSGAGVSAAHSDTFVTLRDTRIDSTTSGEIYTVGIGVVAEESASVVATGIEVSSNEGPGLYAAMEEACITCSGCLILDNQFAGAVAIVGGSLVLDGSTIAGTAAQESIGGGVGIYAAPLDGGHPPSLSVSDTTIQDNAIASVWLSGEGSYTLSGNTIHGGEGWTRESLTKCGDAVYARDSARAWDGTSGLLLENNELLDGLGAGLFLDNATATLSGNSYSDNAVDLVMQGTDCETPPDGYDGEVLASTELCPAYDYATCGDEFALFMTLAEPETGHGAAFMSPSLPGPNALQHPTLPTALPHAYEPAPFLPPTPRLEPLEFRPQPLRPERASPAPLPVPRTR